MSINKKNIINEKLKNREKSQYSDSFAFAIANDIFPICEPYFDVFENETFRIKKEIISDIYIFMQNKFDNKEKVTFDEIKFNIEGNSLYKSRDILIDICRYFYLSKKFDENFWDYFINGCRSAGRNTALSTGRQKFFIVTVKRMQVTFKAWVSTLRFKTN